MENGAKKTDNKRDDTGKKKQENKLIWKRKQGKDGICSRSTKCFSTVSSKPFIIGVDFIHKDPRSILDNAR